MNDPSPSHCQRCNGAFGENRYYVRLDIDPPSTPVVLLTVCEHCRKSFMAWTARHRHGGGGFVPSPARMERLATAADSERADRSARPKPWTIGDPREGVAEPLPEQAERTVGEAEQITQAETEARIEPGPSREGSQPPAEPGEGTGRSRSHRGRGDGDGNRDSRSKGEGSSSRERVKRRFRTGKSAVTDADVRASRKSLVDELGPAETYQETIEDSSTNYLVTVVTVLFVFIGIGLLLAYVTSSSSSTSIPSPTPTIPSPSPAAVESSPKD